MTFLAVKFVCLVFLYKLHLYDFSRTTTSGVSTSATTDSSLLHTTALGAQLAEFRRTSRMKNNKGPTNGRHFLRSRQMADESATAADDRWGGLRSTCRRLGVKDLLLDPFPESFDPILYRHLYKEDLNHYLSFGKDRGYQCSRGQHLREIINQEIVSVMPGSVLEIGPFINPLIRSPKAKYFDIANWDGLVQKAKELSYVVSPQPVTIDYVDASGDLSFIVDAQFSLVVSANVVGVQTDLVRHMQDVSRIMAPGGYYAMIVPDRRFGADHIAEETTVADVLEDFYLPRRRQTMRSLVESAALLSSAAAAEQHWRGDRGALPYANGASDPLYLQHIRDAIQAYHETDLTAPSIDVIKYRFTPQSLAVILDTLFVLGLTELRVHRLYETLADSGEFGLVLTRCDAAAATATN
jgi:SAM-dependent methyltransferase